MRDESSRPPIAIAKRPPLGRRSSESGSGTHVESSTVGERSVAVCHGSAQMNNGDGSMNILVGGKSLTSASSSDLIRVKKMDCKNRSLGIVTDCAQMNDGDGSMNILDGRKNPTTESTAASSTHVTVEEMHCEDRGVGIVGNTGKVQMSDGPGRTNVLQADFAPRESSPVEESFILAGRVETDSGGVGISRGQVNFKTEDGQPRSGSDEERGALPLGGTEIIVGCVDSQGGSVGINLGTYEHTQGRG